MKTPAFENFLWWMVAICNAVGLAIYCPAEQLFSKTKPNPMTP